MADVVLIDIISRACARAKGLDIMEATPSRLDSRVIGTNDYKTPPAPTWW